MVVKDIVMEDFINYKKPSMFIVMPTCSFKCEKECGQKVCQNSSIANLKDIYVSNDDILLEYLANPITHAIVFGGLEPFDSWDDLYTFIEDFRRVSDDDVVIYTGYTENELQGKIDALQQHVNIIVKFGRYVPDRESHYDEILGVNLTNDEQYAKRISLSENKITY